MQELKPETFLTNGFDLHPEAPRCPDVGIYAPLQQSSRVFMRRRTKHPLEYAWIMYYVFKNV